MTGQTYESLLEAYEAADLANSGRGSHPWSIQHEGAKLAGWIDTKPAHAGYFFKLKRDAERARLRMIERIHESMK